MRKILFLIVFALPFMLNARVFHDFVVKDIDGKEVFLSEFKGKKILVVNVASKCGLTPQYKELQELYDKYKDQNFTIIAFPANNFLKQEPGSNEQIKEFCTKNYGVTFPVMAKISVKGEDIHPVYEWLTQEKQNCRASVNVQWNFQKFMIDEEGNWHGTVSPRKSPFSDEIVNWIEGR